MLPRPWIWVEPIRCTASTSPGHHALIVGSAQMAAAGTAAPIVTPLSSATIRISSGMRLTSTNTVGLRAPA